MKKLVLIGVLVPLLLIGVSAQQVNFLEEGNTVNLSELGIDSFRMPHWIL